MQKIGPNTFKYQKKYEILSNSLYVYLGELSGIPFFFNLGGGNGDNGGAGGGGAGGISFGIYCYDSDSIISDNLYTIGTGGLGGSSSGNAGL